MPFLVDSVTMEVNRHGLTLHLIIHPIVASCARADGTLAGCRGGRQRSGAGRESFIHVEVDREHRAAAPRSAGGGRRARARRRAPGGRRLGGDAAARRSASSPSSTRTAPPDAGRGARRGPAFLSWLADNHFTFLGYRCHELVVVDGEGRAEDRAGLEPGHPARATGARGVAAELRGAAAGGPRLRAPARTAGRHQGDRALHRAPARLPRLHRRQALRRRRARSCGEHRFLGLFTSTAYSANPADIPLLRRKIANVVARAGLAPGSHAGKALVNILETYPRDELFQTGDDDLLRTAMGILHLGDRQRFRLFVRRDPFERFLSCLIYVPRENYTTELREKWQEILRRGLQRQQLGIQRAPVGVGAGAHPDHGAHAAGRHPRVRRRASSRPGSSPAARRWDDDLKAALIEARGEARGNELLRRFGDAFPAGYRDEFAARAAVPDIELMARLSDAQPLAMTLYRPLEAAPGMLRFKLLRRGEPRDAVGQPADARAHGAEGARRASVPDRRRRTRRRSGCTTSACRCRRRDADARRRRAAPVFEEAFARDLARRGRERRLQPAGPGGALPAAEVVVLRAYAKYMRQTGFTLRRPTSSRPWPRIRRSRACWSSCSSCASTRRCRTSGAPQAIATIQQIDDALERVENLTRTASCASTWR